MRYRERIIIQDAKAPSVTGGDQNTDTGVYVPNPSPGSGARIVYEGLADVQQRSEQVFNPQLGAAVQQAKVEAFLQNEDNMADIKPDMQIIVNWKDGSQSNGWITLVDRTSGSVLIRGL